MTDAHQEIRSQLSKTYMEEVATQAALDILKAEDEFTRYAEI